MTCSSQYMSGMADADKRVEELSHMGPHPPGALKLKNPLINLPYLTDGADASIVVTQSNACLQYLGRKLALYGAGEQHTYECDQLLCQIMDLRSACVGWFYGSGSREAGPHICIRFLLT